MKIDPKWVKNISEIDIPNHILNFLALRPKFNIEPIIGKY